MRERTTLVLRQNAGRRRLPEFLADLERRLGRAVPVSEVLPLEAADALWAAVTPRLAASRGAPAPAFSRWAPDAAGHLAAALPVFAAALGGPGVLYLPEPSSDLGPVRVDLAEITLHVRDLAEGPAEACTLASADGASGLRLDYEANEHEHGAPHPYELRVWGAAWQAAARETLPFELAAPAA